MAFLSWSRTAVSRGVSTPVWTRSFYASSTVAAKGSNSKAEDPIQKLFVQKLQEYRNKSKGGDLPEASPQFMARRKEELERVKKQYGGGDMESFPKLEFKD